MPLGPPFISASAAPLRCSCLPQPQPPPPPLPHFFTQSKWRVVTQTSNLSGAGTDATVSIQVWGPKGMLGGSEQPLNTSKNDFERNEVDTFFLDVPRERECGYPLEKVGEGGGKVGVALNQGHPAKRSCCTGGNRRRAPPPPPSHTLPPHLPSPDLSHSSPLPLPASPLPHSWLSRCRTA